MANVSVKHGTEWGSSETGRKVPARPATGSVSLRNFSMAEVFRCPSTPDLIMLQERGWDDRGTMPDVVMSDYGYDNGRIDKNSLGGRAVVGDLARHVYVDVDLAQVPPTGLTPEGVPTVDNRHPRQDFNHPAGCNILYFDNSVAWVDVRGWGPFVPLDTPDPEEIQTYIAHPSGINLVRYGHMQNPRLDVGRDERIDSADDPLANAGWGAPSLDTDHDDMFSVDGPNANEFTYAQDIDCNEAGYSQWDAATGVDFPPVLLKSKDDAYIMPCADYLHASGWPE